MKIVLLAFFVGAIVYAPVLYRFLAHGVIHSGEGDGFKQMMPFQLFLYERMSSLSSFYDIGLGLGGDYFTDLSYYYTTSPIMYINFLCIKLFQMFASIDPSQIDFWPANQIFVAYFKCVLTFLVTYGMFKKFNLRNPYRFVGAMLYSTSTILYYFNFTWSFFGDIMLFLPLSIWAMERFFRKRKIGLFIVAIAFTLFSNFYFSYYEALALGAYLIYRMIFTHPDDVITRWKKLWLLIPAVLMSLCIASFGFLTGVHSFTNNDRQLNDFEIPAVIDFSQKYHIFSNGFYFTITFIALVALFTFKFYRYYYYRMFAILTWVLLFGALTPYFDSMFNGFSYPQRRWGYLLILSTSVLISIWLRYITELTWRDYLISLSPLIPLGFATLFFSEGRMWWMIASALILMILAYYVYYRKPISKQIMYLIAGLFVIQQFLLLLNYHTNNIIPHEADTSRLHSAKYHSAELQKKIDEITDRQSPLERIDYMSNYAVNSSMIYGFNGVALYSSIFDGEILEYYDKQMQINMEYDSNSTYRLLGDRANLYALWGVSDRIKKGDDPSIAFGMKPEEQIQEGNTTWLHSQNTFHYPATHLTSKVYDEKDLKSPLDREHAMLQGVVLNGESKNTTFKANPNLLKTATITPRDAEKDGNRLKVKKTLGGLDISMPANAQKQYKDYYLEMDVELLSPDQAHYLKVDDFHQRRTRLDYKYKRFVTHITVRVPAKETMQLKLKKGTYRVKIKGIYGENYETLKQAQQDVTPVKVTQHQRHMRVDLHPKTSSYLVLPLPYRNGLKAEANGEARPVKQGNGLQTVIPVKKGDRSLILSYELPYWRIYVALTIIGLVSAFIYRGWLRRKI
ncbi:MULTISPECIES: YfhO family protein [unclassified Staphylococcus]|uniref:YfhO family protein n=1 Tax=unclassified Staphylococcus TaxID=91994 RepID=UPI0021D2673A|nr:MULTISPECIES: YfhO family protein [unclassified Staphylococcus]UXR72442.1 YfhO family protein [Staphylococcus sp. IVB6240]UXR74745.1 YfhO family protein [Staphylococcus sp. IVB6238]UXR77079.1 YfhO family protein [Staphylococcus sp. IVB6233]UXR81204.1 YfhO family protein [Staphylococcus sp. IVB6218]